MMKMIKKATGLLAAGLAAHASYERTKVQVNRVLDQICVQWSVDDDSMAMYEAAVEVAEEFLVKVPRQRRYRTSENDMSKSFNVSSWTPVRVPGVAGLVQAKRSGHYDITFRALRWADLNAIRAYIRERSEVSYDDVEVDFEDEYIHSTTISGWDSKTENWVNRKVRTSRTFKSVFLPVALQAEIEADLLRFTESKKRLQRLELPWRRGYLFEGPPGTGKTTVSFAIAGALGFRVAPLRLSEIKGDKELNEAISKLPSRTVVVIEDIDAYSVSNDRNHNTTKDGALSLSGLLNALDGFETPEGLVVIATTNHPERLDPALIRSGRFDQSFHLGYIQSAEAERLFKWFYEKPAPWPLTGFERARLAPAEMTEIFKQHLNDPEEGWLALGARLGENEPAPVAA